MVCAAGGRSAVLHRDTAAERDRQPAHGACLPGHGDGRAHPLPPHARRLHPLAAGRGPCRHRHADGGGAAARSRGPEPPRTGARGVRPAGLGVEGVLRRAYRGPVAQAGRVAGLLARLLHAGRSAQPGGTGSLRAAARRRPDLPRPEAGELGPRAANRPVRPGSRVQRGRRPPVASALPPCGRRGRGGGGHDAPGNHAGRHRRGGASRRRALSAAGRPHGAPAADRARNPHRGGRGG